jgi:DnaJ-class molecular chaperone
MSDLYATLGVAKNASQDEIKKAYRKLAQTHHPDKGGDEAKFKEIQTAYDTLGDEQKRAQHDRGGNGHQPFGAYGNSQMDDILRQMRESMHRAQQTLHMQIRVPIAKAFKGEKLPITVNGRSIAYQVKAGIPQGVTYIDEIPFEDKMLRAEVSIVIDGGPFRFIRPGTMDGRFFSGDLEADIEVDALDLILGGWTVVTDFLGKQLQVRIPEGFDLATRLRVAGHGYSHWVGDAQSERGDLHLRVIPKFGTIKDLDVKKIEDLAARVVAAHAEPEAPAAAEGEV